VTPKVRFDPAAVAEARAARDWYNTASPGLGADFVSEMWRTIDQVRQWPALSSRLEVEGVSDEVRRAPLRRFPFGVIYLVRADALWVVAVAHARRRPGYWRGRA
jgi:toxin ParE1/3/4